MPIRIVRTFDQHQLRAATPTILTDHGGLKLDNRAKGFNVYLGNVNFDVADFTAFSKAVIENGYYIDPTGKQINGTFIGSVSSTWPFGGMTVSDGQIAQWVDGMVDSQAFPPEDGQTVYALMFPPGSTVNAFGASSCTAFCGYHTHTPKNRLYMVICDSSCPGCHGSFAVNDGRMMIYSHEWGESMSDPFGDGWFDNANGEENGDECAWNRVAWGPSLQWAVQPEMTDTPAGCMTGAYVSGVPVPQPPPPPVPQPPPPPVPQPPPPPPPVVSVSFGPTVISDGKMTATFSPEPLPAGFGTAKTIKGAISYSPSGKRQTYSVGLGTPRTPVGKLLRWLGERL